MISGVNLASKTWCEKAYKDYYYNKNTMGLTPDDIAKIEEKYSSSLSSWKAEATADDVDYDIDDDNLDDFVNNGRESAKKAGGGEKDNAGDIAAAAGHTVGGAVAGTFGIAAAAGAGSAVGGALVKTLADKAGKKVGEELVKNALEFCSTEAEKELLKPTIEFMGELTAKKTTETATKEIGDAVGFIIATTVGAATATAYLAKKPNQEEVEICNNLQSTMADAQKDLETQQTIMQKTGEKAANMSEKAVKTKENAEKTIAKQQEQYDSVLLTYSSLKSSAEAGADLTDSERAFLKESAIYLQKTGEAMKSTSVNANSKSEVMRDKAAGLAENYEVVANTMDETQGMTDYAESIDKTTQILCGVEGAAQTLNAAGSAAGAVKAGIFASTSAVTFGATAWAWAFVALGAFGFVTSTAGAAEQFKMVGDVGDEIELREDTQDLNAETQAKYVEELDNFDNIMQGFEDVEIVELEEVESFEELGDSSGQTKKTKETGTNI